ncbi:MAG TPA: SDR family oxidoreductase, partial [Novosphingobium sp.]|nr:SDR family oxidoreductase [Novosphingobium sp.]
TASGGEAAAVKVDVLSTDSIAAAVAEVESRFGQVDILVNNVGAILNGTMADIPVAAWERIEQLNHGAVVRGVRAVLPAMLARGTGHIVCTASFAGMYPYASTRLPYAASKAAVISLCQNLALDCEPQGVRVSCLIPGPVATTIGQTMTNYSPNLPMRGPGAGLGLLTTGQAAQRFADGMEAGRILIPSDEGLWSILRDWAADPDAFVREKIAQAQRGEWGLPAHK